jgi:hypothetical protein
MYFCPNCSNIFDISKSSNSINNKTIIDKVNNIFKIIENNENFNNYKAGFTKEELLKNKKYQKLNDDIKNNISVIFEEDNLLTAILKCNICNYSEEIKKTMLLYQIDNNINNDNLINIKTLEENKLFIKDPLLPHTHDYICKNPNCITHKQNNIRDSVFFRDKDSFKLNYICCICFYSW